MDYSLLEIANGTEVPARPHPVEGKVVGTKWHAERYPDNQHGRAKIREQLQVLRDEGHIEFPGDGEYRLRWIDRHQRA